jgi:hypothetical protein
MPHEEYDPRREAGLTEGWSATGDEAADTVSNRTGGKYTEGDASAETGVPGTETEAAWHSARDDHEADAGLPDRHDVGWGTGSSDAAERRAAQGLGTRGSRRGGRRGGNGGFSQFG